MGRKNKNYSRSLREQVCENLTEMLHAGEGCSKKEAVKDGTVQNKIFSYSTYHTYKKHCLYFVDYIKRVHPECTTLKAAKKYIKEWLQYRTDSKNLKGETLSAWTIQTERQALSKLYGIKPDDAQFFDAPQRKRRDIKRSRITVNNDKHFSEKNNVEFVEFCKGTGCRRNVMEKLEGRDLYTREELMEKILMCVSEKEKYEITEALELFPDKQYFIHHRKDKGGRSRYAPIIGLNLEAIVKRMKATEENEKVWKNVFKHADIHGYRSDYATELYKEYARDIKDIPYDKFHNGIKQWYQSEVYVCRDDEAGKKLDRLAMLKCSKALGHNRLEVVANNYIRGL